MGMTIHLVPFIVLFILCVLAAAISMAIGGAHREDMDVRFGFTIFIFIVVAFMAVYVGVSAGHGYVSRTASPLSGVLSNGKEYSLIGVIHSSKGVVLIVEDGNMSSDGHIHVLRTNDKIPPMHFIMLNGEVFGISSP